MRLFAGPFAIVCWLAVALTAWAGDEASARKYIDEAKHEIEMKSWSGATSKLELADAELDGLDAPTKAALTTQIDGLRQQIKQGQSAGDKAKYTRDLDRALAEAEGAIGNLVTWSGAEAQLIALFDNSQAKAVIGPELDAAKRKLETFRKLHAKKAGAQLGEQADSNVEAFEKEWNEEWKKALTDADASPNSKESAAVDAQRSLDRIRDTLGELPDDNDRKKPLTARVDKIAAELGQLAGASKVQDVLDRLKRGWESNQSYFEGWEKETDPPTWDEYGKESSEAMSAFGMKQSSELISRYESFMENRKDDADYKLTMNHPQVKALMDGYKEMRDDAYAKVLKATKAIVDAAEEGDVTNDNRNNYDRLDDSIRLALGENDKDGLAMRASIEKKVKDFEAATVGAAEARDKWYQELSSAAASAWPDMSAKFSTESGFDPNNYQDWKGKTIKITTDNLMGWRFKPGDFPFATTLNGIPVAAKYDPVVRDAIAEVEAKMGRALGDNDSDGRWEIIATVDGTQGRMMARKQVEGDIRTDSGEKVGTYRGEYPEPVDAPIITIIAAHVGPLAVAVGQGAVKGEGKIEAPDAPSGSGGASAGSGWMVRILTLLIGLTAALCALIKAQFAPVLGIPGIGQMQTRLGAGNISLLGLICAAWGVYLMVTGLIIWGLLVWAAILAAGLYAGMDFLVARGLIKPELAQKLRPLGVAIGLACAAVVIIHLFTGGSLGII